METSCDVFTTPANRLRAAGDVANPTAPYDRLGATARPPGRTVVDPSVSVVGATVAR